MVSDIAHQFVQSNAEGYARNLRPKPDPEKPTGLGPMIGPWVDEMVLDIVVAYIILGQFCARVVVAPDVKCPAEV